MIHKVARFKVKEDKVGECLDAIHEFLKAVREEPGTVKYEAYELPDKVSFIHLMTFHDEAAEAAHRESAHTKKFTDALYPHCEIQPEFIDVESIV
jgi:quinol monooxygenase YgiN